MLLTALLAVQATYTAKADTIYSGHYYDNGKEMCSSLPKPDSGEEVRSHYDDYYCWANAASNLVQYWQDTEAHLNLANNPDSTPNGTDSAKPTVSPYGTSYLDVYTDFLNSTYNTEDSDTSAYQSALLEWYFRGTPITNITDTSKQDLGGYYTGAFVQNPSYTTQGPDSTDASGAQVMRRANFDNFIKTNIDKAGGSVGIDVNRKNPDGQQNKAHAITCVGYEIGADGKISSIIVTDSDDKYFGTFKLQVKEDTNGYVALLTDNKVLKQDAGDEVYFLGRDYLEAKNYVYNLTAIATPGGGTKAEDAHTEIGGSKEVMENTRLSNSQELNGSVTVGDGNTVVVLTTDSGKKLTIGGNEKGNPALDITRGALVSVDSLEVKNSADGGVRAVGNLHVGGNAASGDTATFTDNATSGNGGAIENKSFVDISGNDTVVFEGNHADGMGGAIYSQGTDNNPQTYDNTTVSIRGNGSVTFTGNTALLGNDIYVGKGSFLNIADNGSVLFQGTDSNEAAIVNRGEVYLEGREYKETITFDNCSIDSMGGTVYIGYDINKSGGQKALAGYGWAPVVFTDGTNTLNVYTLQNCGPVTFENVIIKDTGVYGESAAKSLVSNMHTDTESSDYVLENLTLDTTSHLGEFDAENTITLNNVNIALGEGDFDKDHTFDISSLFQTTTNFNGAITFDASSLGLKPEELPEEMLVQLKNDVIGALEEDKKLIKFITGGYEYEFLGAQGSIMKFGNAQPVVPEPTTGTLSLLALAGLAARRRRKG